MHFCCKICSWDLRTFSFLEGGWKAVTLKLLAFWTYAFVDSSSQGKFHCSYSIKCPMKSPINGCYMQLVAVNWKDATLVSQGTHGWHCLDTYSPKPFARTSQKQRIASVQEQFIYGGIYVWSLQSWSYILTSLPGISDITQHLKDIFYSRTR